MSTLAFRRHRIAIFVMSFAIALASFHSVAEMLPREKSAEGWIQLFDGETAYGWTTLGDAVWKAEGGALAGTGRGGWTATTSKFADFELEAQIRLKADQASGIVLRAPLEDHWSENGATFVALDAQKGESKWRAIKIKAEGNTVTATVDGAAATVQTGGNKAGHIGVLFMSARNFKDGKVEIKDVNLRPLSLKPIFDGKTLEGWNIIPGHKSEFKVLDGAINITNGNGQIESAGTYKNPALQLDIIANGKALNSGVFFRGPVGVFWKGYEAQVRNQWTGEDRTKPVDYGTGGNYGNLDSRRVIPSEGEWFTMTVIANGNHTAVWVNGYQTSDFTDVRPPHPQMDGTQGYAPNAGTIHLQGHDPTTNLSFKNIRVMETPDR